MVLESPTSAEKKRFEELQKQGLLPSESLKKIETERRLGITPEEPVKRYPLGITKDNWWFYVAAGALLTGYLYLRFKSPPTTKSASTHQLNERNTEYVEYIDLYQLEFEEEYY